MSPVCLKQISLSPSWLITPLLRSEEVLMFFFSKRVPFKIVLDDEQRAPGKQRLLGHFRANENLYLTCEGVRYVSETLRLRFEERWGTLGFRLWLFVAERALIRNGSARDHQGKSPSSIRFGGIHQIQLLSVSFRTAGAASAASTYRAHGAMILLAFPAKRALNLFCSLLAAIGATAKIGRHLARSNGKPTEGRDCSCCFILVVDKVALSCSSLRVYFITVPAFVLIWFCITPLGNTHTRTRTERRTE